MWSWPRWLVGILLIGLTIAALPGIVSQADGRLVYPLDDAYIHMAMAKNLARHGVWGCTPFHFSSSSSSLLWTLALGATYAVTGVREVTPFALNVLAATLMLVVADRYLVRLALPALLRAITIVGLVIAVQLPAMVLMGMEHVLHLLLTLAFAIAATDLLTRDTGPPTGRGTLWLCALAALLAGSRFEGFFLVGAVCLACLVRGRAILGATIGAAALAPVVLFGAISIANGSLFLPIPCC